MHFFLNKCILKKQANIEVGKIKFLHIIKHDLWDIRDVKTSEIRGVGWTSSCDTVFTVHHLMGARIHQRATRWNTNDSIFVCIRLT